MNDDGEIRMMQWMTVDQLARYSDALETIEKEQMFQANWEAEGRREDSSDKLLTEKEREELFGSMGAMAVKVEIIDNLFFQAQAWDKLTPMACEALERLVNEGVLPDTCGSREKFWGLVYRCILQNWGNAIGSDPAFKNVLIVEFLKRVLPNRLGAFVAHYRERGNPVLAQVMEQLAEN